MDRREQRTNRFLTFVLYLRRHRRRGLVVSYLGMNVGVLAVATALSGSAAGLGLGVAYCFWARPLA